MLGRRGCRLGGEAVMYGDRVPWLLWREGRALVIRCSGLLRGGKYENPAAISQRRLNMPGLSTLAFDSVVDDNGHHERIRLLFK